ncbi:MAG: UDP-N-acetylmuramoyl-L-alanine--D-glutamate ligase [Spirochaetia bacterium]|nr:UDP-N-acetylmuramoyl-L-alanine--D-glutamate ligase [Spirochaetia bacterium]
MQNLDFKKIQKVLLVGAGGKTGYWYARLLIQNGIEVYAFDQNEKVVYSDELLNDKLFHKVSAKEFSDAGILDKIDSVTLSPGVPLNQNIFLKAKEQNKFIFSELEYSYSKLADRHWICVTGTDGKSTTVALIEHSLNSFGKDAVSCGNFGLSFSKIAYEKNQYAKYKYLVAELSSYQLELCRNLQSEVSLYLNLAPDHLNRYKDLEEYGRVKYHIAETVKENGLFIVNKELLPGNSKYWITNHPFEKISKLLNTSFVDTHHIESSHFQILNQQIVKKKNNENILALKNLKIQGQHNYTNVLFTLEVLDYFHCTDNEKIAKSLSTFESLPHRYEKIFIKNQEDKNIYINDSKATTTQAAGIAIQNSKSPLFIFMGGRSKGEDYQPLALIIQNQQAHVFLYGENKKELHEVFKKNNVNVIDSYETLELAFYGAIKYQKEKKLTEVTYLLSPASTSWDQYSSFEERGEYFKKLVQSI